MKRVKERAAKFKIDDALVVTSRVLTWGYPRSQVFNHS